MRARIVGYVGHAFARKYLFAVALATLVVKYTGDPGLFENDHINSIAITSSGEAAKLTCILISVAQASTGMDPSAAGT